MRLFLGFLSVGIMILTGACTKPLEHQPQSKINSVTRVGQVALQKNFRNYIFKFPKNTFHAGDENAQVSIVMFVNYLCANCARAHEVFQSLLKDNSLNTSVSISYRQLPKTQNGVKAAKIVLAAGLQGADKYWSMSQMLFEQKGEVREEDYLELAEKAQVDSVKLARDLVLRETELTRTLRQDRIMAQFVNRHGRKTGIFVNGYYFAGDVSLASLKHAINTVLAHQKRQQQQQPTVIEVPM